jgi:hypothetical protein
MTVFTSILLFHNPITVVGLVGYLICVAGVFCYGRAKHVAVQQPKAPPEEEALLKPGVLASPLAT